VIRHAFAWSHGCAEVLSTAAMLARCVFELDGVTFEPLASAEWAGTGVTGHPGHLRELGGEFVGLPFGEGGITDGVVDAWQGIDTAARNATTHGPAADEEWELVELRDGGVTLRLDYPAAHPIAWVERRIDGVPGEPALALSLTIAARRDTSTSLGLHPILRLPERAGGLRLHADFEVGLSYPAILPPGVARSLPGRRFRPPASVRDATGTADFGSLPLDGPAEEVVQLCGMRGPIVVDFVDEGASLTIDWDRELLPSAQLWLSDRMLRDEPWNGRYRGLGIEPIASAFDLAESVSTAPNPINAEGVATAIVLRRDRPLTVDYRLVAAANKK
jgi:hypothetical protein